MIGSCARRFPRCSFLILLMAFAFNPWSTNDGYGQSITTANPPTNVAVGNLYEVDVAYNVGEDSIVQIQMFQALESSWRFVDQMWASVSADTQSVTIPFLIPSNEAPDDNYLWQVRLYNEDWGPLDEKFYLPVTVSSGSQTNELVGSDAPEQVQAGESYEVTVNYNVASAGIVQVQLLDSLWDVIDQDWTNVGAGSQSTSVTIEVPSDEPSADDSMWQVLLYREDPTGWTRLDEVVTEDISIGGNTGGPNIAGLGDKNWVLEFDEDFDEDIDGAPKTFFPQLGTNVDEVARRVSQAQAENRIPEKGLRYPGDDEDQSWMYSMASGCHWVENGILQMQARVDKDVNLVHGKRVECAYLMSAFPNGWENDEPTWDGYLVNPEDDDLYFEVKAKTNQMVGYSSWFAFWLFSHRFPYDRIPATGSEIDIIEVPVGKPDWMEGQFNVAHHWGEPTEAEAKAGIKFSESEAFLGQDAKDLADVTADTYHTYGLHWSAEAMTATTYVNGVPVKTYPDNPPGNPFPPLPVNPTDMMMMLTIEFQKDAWVIEGDDQGDGRTETDPIEEDSRYRVMSRAQVEHVRVWRAQ